MNKHRNLYYTFYLSIYYEQNIIQSHAVNLHISQDDLQIRKKQRKHVIPI